MVNSLIFQATPHVILGTNTFINVPIVLKYEDINLIEVIKQEQVGFTTQIPIYHSDGTYLAKVIGNRLRLTDEGKKTGLSINKYKDVWVCSMENRTLFEIHQQNNNFFKTTAELYTPDGCFIKWNLSQNPNLIDPKSDGLRMGGIMMSGSQFTNCKIGIWFKKDGSCLIGVN